MVKKNIRVGLIMKFYKVLSLLFVITLSQVVLAQGQLDDEIQYQEVVGYWQKEGSSTILELKRAEDAIQGVITRADWEPNLIGKTYIRELSADKKPKTWVGEGYDQKKDRYRKVSISVKEVNVIKIKIKGRRSALWRRVESKDKVM